MNPEQSYRQRLASRRAEQTAMQRQENLLSYIRVAIFSGGLVLAWSALFADRLSSIWLVLPVVAFLAAVVLHEGRVRGRVRAERAVAFYERGLSRLADDWAGEGERGDRFLDASHPYASDLDLFGDGSLFQLLSTARSAAGERMLAEWLSAPASPEEIRRRQAAVEELRSRVDLREDLALLGQDVGSGIDPQTLIDWAEGTPVLAGRWPPRIGAAIAALQLGALLLWFDHLARFLFSAAPPPGAHFFSGSGPFWISAAIGAGFALWYRRRTHRVLHAADRPLRELQLLAQLLARLERERFDSPLLREQHASLVGSGRPASRRIAALARLVQVDESRHNKIFAPIAALLLLGTQLAFAMERWRGGSGPDVSRWLAALGRLEALLALAGYAFEHPNDPFPEIVETAPSFEGRGLGHPLLPDAECVRNDVALGDPVRLLIVSGSNMSGKSTLLRTIGINAVLAQAGAPVRAYSLRLSPLALGASMRIVDSLQEGTSHFYAEIKKLRAIVDLAGGERTLLFLLDEILHGTNSHDRRVGAEALVRELVRRGAVGLVTTHDLALAGIVERLGSAAANVHFVDHLEDGKIVFDFKLRPGVVDRGNALALMRAVGLDV